MKRRIMFKVEKGRVLVPVGEPCSFGCRYCYTRSGEVGLARVETEEIIRRLRQFAQNTHFETIQFGYDGDPFACPERGLAMLRQMAGMGKHINFSTKALLEGPVLDALRAFRHTMDEHKTICSALVSLSCWDSAPIVEPHTPSPAERMRTVTNLTRIGIPAFIAIRPVLPHISDAEYRRIVVEGMRAGSAGFILGPLYGDTRGQSVRFIPPASLAMVPHRSGIVSWSAHAPIWTRYEDAKRLQRLVLMIEQQGGLALQSSVDALSVVHHLEAAG